MPADRTKEVGDLRYALAEQGIQTCNIKFNGLVRGCLVLAPEPLKHLQLMSLLRIADRLDYDCRFIPSEYQLKGEGTLRLYPRERI